MDLEFAPLTNEDIIARALEAEEDIKNGRFITLEELEKEMESW